MMTVAQPWLKLLRFIKIIWPRRPVSQLTYLSPTLPPLTHKSDTSPISKYIWNTSNLLLLSNDLEINPGPRQIDKTQCFAAYIPTKLTVEFNRIRHLPAPLRIVMHDAIKLTITYLFIKLAMRKILIALYPGNVLNMALVLSKLLLHLLQFMRSQVVLLLLENPAPSVKIQFGLVMLT